MTNFLNNKQEILNSINKLKGCSVSFIPVNPNENNSDSMYYLVGTSKYEDLPNVRYITSEFDNGFKIELEEKLKEDNWLPNTNINIEDFNKNFLRTLKVKNLSDKSKLIHFMKEHDINLLDKQRSKQGYMTVEYAGLEFVITKDIFDKSIIIVNDNQTLILPFKEFKNINFYRLSQDKNYLEMLTD